MDAVFPEYEMLPDSVGLVNCLINVCWADSGLSRPTELVSATTTMFNGESASVNGTVMVAVVSLMKNVTPDLTNLLTASRTSS